MTGNYFRASCGALTFLLVVVGVLILVHLRSIESNVDEQTSVVRRRAAIVRDMELGIIEYVSSVRAVLNSSGRERSPEEDATELDRRLAEYKALAKNPRHLEVAVQFAATWAELVAESEIMMDDARAGQEVDRARFRTLHKNLTTFLVDKMQLASVEDFNVLRDVADRDIQTVFTLSIARTAGELAIALLLGLTVFPYVFKMEKTLRGNEQRFRIVVESAPVGLLVVDRDGRIALSNRRAEQLFGYSREELLGQPVELLVPERFCKEHPEKRDKYFAAPEPRAMGAKGDLRCVTKNGNELLVEIGLVPIQTDAGLLVLVAIVDITERKAAEDALRRSEERLARAQQAAAVGAWDWDMRTNQATWTDQGWKLFGREPGAFPITYKNWLSCIHPDDRNAAIAAAKQARDVGTYFDEIRVIGGADGTVRWVETRGEYIYDDARRPVRMIGTVHDITKRKQAEQRLERIQAKLSAVIENTQDAVWSIDHEMRLIFGNAAFHNLYQSVFGTEPIIGQSMTQRLPTADLEELREQFQVMWRRSLAGERCRDVFCLPFWERPRFLEVSFNPIRSGDTITGVVADSRDITEYKVTAEALSRARDELEQRIAERTANLQEANERLSVMAGGLSHELNQPLTAIANFAAGCLLRVGPQTDENGAICRALTSIVKEVHRSGELIRRLRHLTARTSLDRQSNSINEAVRDTLAIVESIRGGIEVKVTCHLCERLPMSSFDRLLITQVLLNLIRNGMDATMQMEPSRRELTIESVESEDGCLQVNVRDNGVGLSDEAMKHLFTPFRSTKSGGMGLGLVISRDIVELHGGRLWASQLVAGGASFHFTLPISS